MNFNLLIKYYEQLIIYFILGINYREILRALPNLNNIIKNSESNNINCLWMLCTKGITTNYEFRYFNDEIISILDKHNLIKIETNRRNILFIKDSGKYYIITFNGQNINNTEFATLDKIQEHIEQMINFDHDFYILGSNFSISKKKTNKIIENYSEDFELSIESLEDNIEDEENPEFLIYSFACAIIKKDILKKNVPILEQFNWKLQEIIENR